MGNALSGGATKSILEYLETHDGDITPQDIHNAYPELNIKSIYSAFGSLEGRGKVVKTSVNGQNAWRKTRISPVDRALYQFCRKTAMIGG